MNIDINDIITLNNNFDYVVINKLKYQDKIYYYLMNINDNTNILFCYEKKDSLIEVNDKYLITTLMTLFIHEFLHI